MRHRSWLGVVLVLLAAMLWGTTGTAQRLAPAQVSPFWIGALRLAISAGFFMLVSTAVDRRGSARLAGTPLARTLLAGLCVASYNLSFFAGVRWSGVALGTTLAIGSGPVFAGVLQALVVRRAPPVAWWLGTALAVGGGATMASGGGSARPGAAGVALCLLAGLSYAGYTLLAKSLSAHASPARVSLRIFGIAAVFAVPAAWALAGPVALGPQGWLVVGYLGLVATGVAYLLFSHALRHISGATAVSLALAEPVTAFVLAAAVLGERPGAAGVAGLVCILAGLAVVVAVETRPAR